MVKSYREMLTLAKGLGLVILLNILESVCFHTDRGPFGSQKTLIGAQRGLGRLQIL